MRVSIGDCKLYFDVEGLGLVPSGATMVEQPVLLALHGGPGFDHTSFKPRFGAMADVAQVIYVDHRGQGRSDRCSPETWNLAQWADDVVALCAALEIERPFVYGVSFGSMVALQYAIRHPGHTRGVIADSTAAFTDAPSVIAQFARLGGERAAHAAQAFWDDPNPETIVDYFSICMPLYNQHRSPDAADSSARSLERANFALFQHWTSGEHRTFDLRPTLHKITSPTLILAGQEDPITPLAGGQAAANAIGSCAQFVSFQDCGHGVWRDQSESAMATMRSFIAETP